MADEIIEELWKIKDDIARECGYDVKTLVARLEDKKYDKDRQAVDLRFIKQTTDQVSCTDPNQTGVV